MCAAVFSATEHLRRSDVGPCRLEVPVNPTAQGHPQALKSLLENVVFSMLAADLARTENALSRPFKARRFISRITY
jgi:hypothetical protein